MTTEEKETLFYLLLSDGTFETESLWHAEQDGLLAIYNGGSEEQSFETAVSFAPCLLYGAPEAKVSQGILLLKIPPRSLAVVADKEGRGFLKNGILYRKPIKGGVVQCEEDAIMAQYLFYGGKPELTGIYKNGDILLDEEGTVRFFRWNKMQPIE